MADRQALTTKSAFALQYANTEQREIALKQATELIDREFAFRGQQRSVIQALAWPRSHAYRNDGSAIEGIPDEVKDATVFLAGLLLAEEPIESPILALLFEMLAPIISQPTRH